MATMTLQHSDSLAVLIERLEGATIERAEVTPDINGASRVTVRLELSNGLTFCFKAGPRNAAYLEGDQPLPQWLGTGEQAPVDVAQWQLRAVK